MFSSVLLAFGVEILKYNLKWPRVANVVHYCHALVNDIQRWSENDQICKIVLDIVQTQWSKSKSCIEKISYVTIDTKNGSVGIEVQK